jgi:hypothetical protein
MNTRAKRVTAGAIGAVAVAGIVTAVVVAVGLTGGAAPEPTSTREAVVYERPADNVDISTTSPSSERKLAEAAAAQAEADRVAAEQAAAQAEADRIAAEQQAAQPSAPERSDASQGGPVADQPAAPIRCPAGSSANSGDGGNDTSCLPDHCFHVVIADPTPGAQQYPECEVAFKP